MRQPKCGHTQPLTECVFARMLSLSSVLTVPPSLNQPSAVRETSPPRVLFLPPDPPASSPPGSGPRYTRVGKLWPTPSPPLFSCWSTPHPSVDILSVSAFRDSGTVEWLGQRPYGLQSLKYSPSGFLQKLCQPSVVHSCEAGLSRQHFPVGIRVLPVHICPPSAFPPA